jgi:hypothetical protein
MVFSLRFLSDQSVGINRAPRTWHGRPPVFSRMARTAMPPLWLRLRRAALPAARKRRTALALRRPVDSSAAFPIKGATWCALYVSNPRPQSSAGASDTRLFGIFDLEGAFFSGLAPSRVYSPAPCPSTTECLKKLVLEAEATGFQDPNRVAGSLWDRLEENIVLGGARRARLEADGCILATAGGPKSSSLIRIDVRSTKAGGLPLKGELPSATRNHLDVRVSNPDK